MRRKHKSYNPYGYQFDQFSWMGLYMISVLDTIDFIDNFGNYGITMMFKTTNISVIFGAEQRRCWCNALCNRFWCYNYATMEKVTLHMVL